ncbi:MAG: hypothetical protein DIU60_016400 [Actinomycetes bacterium]
MSTTHPAHTATSSAARGSAPARASTSASTPAPRAITASEAGSSQPSGRK